MNTSTSNPLKDVLLMLLCVCYIYYYDNIPLHCIKMLYQTSISSKMDDDNDDLNI